MSQAILTVQTPAKINPVLEVLGPRPDGYHELALVFQAIGLTDELSFSREREGVQLSILESPEALAVDDSNLIVKAARLFFKEVLRDQGGVHIQLKKRIPLAAGLGGGSSDAAATLQGLDWLFETRADAEKLQAMAAQLGSDVPFFLSGGTALGTGRGEKINPWPVSLGMSLVLVKPALGLPTPAVYRSGKAQITSGQKAEGFQYLLREKNLPRIAQNLFNGLESAAFYLMPEVEEIKKRLLGAGALGALVSGSGPTVFAVAESREKAEALGRLFQGEGRRVFVTETLSSGVQRI